MAIKYCMTHEIGWDYHDRDSSCEAFMTIKVTDAERLMLLNALAIYENENSRFPTLRYDIECLAKKVLNAP